MNFFDIFDMIMFEVICVVLLVYLIEVMFLDILCWCVGNMGIDYLYMFDSGKFGKYVMIFVLMYGNEVSGVIVVDVLLMVGLWLVVGWLLFGFGNVGVYEYFSVENVDVMCYFDEDMNCVWMLVVFDGMCDSCEFVWVWVMWLLLDMVDLLFDIYLMYEVFVLLMMMGLFDKVIVLVVVFGMLEYVIVDCGYVNGMWLCDYGGFGDLVSVKNVLLIEMG